MLLSVAASLTIPCAARAEAPDKAQVSVHFGREGCAVELDASPMGKTDSKGTLVLREVEPTDHYVHVRCPDQDEKGFFVSPRAGEGVELHPKPESEASQALSPLEAAEAKIRLRGLIQQAVQMRAQGRLEEAVQQLRDATNMDPENSDLHRELGITFLLGKEWKRARVEMLEAIRHKPDDADAHNGLGYALEKLGEPYAALKEYRTATRLEPDDPVYRQHYFQALARLSAKQEEKKTVGRKQ